VLFDKSIVKIQCLEDQVRVVCIGLPYTIVEVAQFLAWIGAALRACSDQNAICYCIAQPILQEECPTGDRTVHLEIQFSEVPLGADENSMAKGCCWQNLVGNPVIAKGFPIPRRPTEVTGLEVSVDVMGALVDAINISVFDGVAVLKGYNAAVALIDQSGPFLLWHSIVNEFGKRLAYDDPRVLKSRVSILPSEIPSIRTSRNILGWTPKVSYNIGEPDRRRVWIDAL